MPNWKKVIVSGSTAELLNVSASGGFKTDGTGSFGRVESTAFDVTTFTSTTVETTDVSGSFTSTGSFGRIETKGNSNIEGQLEVGGLLDVEGKAVFEREPIQGFNYLARLAEGEVSASAKAHTFTATAATKTSNHPYKNLGSGNGYILDGVETPFLYLTEGYYKFDYSGATSHPIRFYFDAGKTTQYNPSSHVSVSGNVITLKIDKDSPQIIYYQCSSHGYMGWAIHTGQNSLLQDETGMKVVVSGSSQIATNISGSFTSVSASIAADVASNLANRRSNTTISGSFTSLSSSVATDIASNLSSITANSSSAAADIAANLVSITNNSSSAAADIATNLANRRSNATISGSTTSLSSSVAADIAANLVSITNNSSSAATDIAARLPTAGGTITGDLSVGGTLTAQEIHTEFESASILFTSGSTRFGDDTTDTHRVTGSMDISGSLKLPHGDVTITDTLTATNIGAFNLTGKLTAGSTEIEGSAFDINGGTIDGITSLTAGGDLDIGSHGFRAETITADGLTATRVVFAGSNGLLSDDSDLTFSGATLSATNITTTGTIKDFAVVSGSKVSTGSFGTVEVNGDPFNTAISKSAAASGFGSGTGGGGDTRSNATISGSFTSVSASIAADIAGTTARSATTITGSFTSLSASIAADVATNLANRRTDRTISGSFRGELSSSNITFVGGGVSGSSVSTGSFGRVIATSIEGITALDDVTRVSGSSTSTGSFGRIEASVVSASSFPGLGVGQKYKHNQSAASKTWTVTHNFNYQYVNVDVYDGNDAIVIPTSIVATNENTITITFLTEVSGVAIVSTGGQAVDEKGKNFVFEQSAASTNWRVTHSIGEQYPAVTVYDGQDKVIIPDEIIARDGSKMDITFAEAISGQVNVSVGGGTPSGTVSSSLQLSRTVSGSWRGELSSSNMTVIGGGVSGSSISTGSFGRVEAAGVIFADSFESNTGGTTIDFKDNVSLTGNLTATGNISSSFTSTGSFGRVLSTTGKIGDVDINGSTVKDFSSISGSSVSTGSFGEVTATGMTVASLTEFSSSVATKFNSLDGDIIALSIALG